MESRSDPFPQAPGSFNYLRTHICLTCVFVSYCLPPPISFVPARPSFLAQDEGLWDDGSVTLSQLNSAEMDDILHKAKSMSTSQLRAEINKLEGSSIARTQSLGAIVRGGQITEDTAANPEGDTIRPTGFRHAMADASTSSKPSRSLGRKTADS